MNRRAFLRSLVATVAAGLGAVAVPRPAAAMVGTRCCPTSQCTSITCPTGKRRHLCTNFCEDITYCACHSQSSCFNTGC